MPTTTERTSIPSRSHGAPLGQLALGALGVVFGDIGTSPLYTLRECTSAEHGVPPTPENVLGLLSLVFWALTMVVSVKYLGFVMRRTTTAKAASSLYLPYSGCPRSATIILTTPNRNAGRVSVDDRAW